MLIKCRDITQLSSLKKLKIIAGEEGLDRIVKWVHVCDMPDVVNWVNGGELLFMTGMSLKCPMDLLRIVQDISAKNLAGLVITGSYLEKIPQEVLDLADTLKFPLFELPGFIKLVEVIKEAATYINDRQAEEKSMRDILKNLIFGDIDNPEFITKRAAFYNYNLNEPSQVAIACINNLEEYLLQKRCNTEDAIVDTKERFYQIIIDIVSHNYLKPLFLPWLDSLIILFPVKKQTESAIDFNKEIAHKCIDELNRVLPRLKVNIGLGSLCKGPKEIRQSLQQAEQALKYAASNEEDRVCEYENLGLNKLLFAVNEDLLQSFYQEYILNLKEYDEEHGTNLISDLKVFLECNGNFGDAARSLYIHRNTLIYRMNKIEELTGKSLENFQNRIGFYIGIMIKKYSLLNFREL